MRYIFPIISSLLIIIGVSFIASMMLRFFNKRIWQSIYLQKFAKWLPRATALSQLIWLVGIVLGAGVFYLIGGSLTTVLIFFILALVLALPISWLFYQIGSKVTNTSHNEQRRKFLKSIAGVFPVAALSFAATGVVKSYSKVKVPIIEVPVPDLPLALNGLRIAHLSDLHLGYYFQLDELQLALYDIKAQNPDIFFVTGDVADELHQLDKALNMINGLDTPHKGFASVGNHEYYRGIDKVISVYGDNPVPLLLDHGVTIQINGQPVYIGGADDPVSHRLDMQSFLRNTIEKSMQDAPENAFKILLSHRPAAFDIAQNMGVHLTLAGHTHGAQFGFNGRSFFEGNPVERYLWGLYSNKGKSLYTSCGMGHWFPFRFGCPAEAPILVLKRAKA